jgi:hypothetical protein
MISESHIGPLPIIFLPDSHEKLQVSSEGEVAQPVIVSSSADIKNSFFIPLKLYNTIILSPIPSKHTFKICHENATRGTKSAF